MIGLKRFRDYLQAGQPAVAPRLHYLGVASLAALALLLTLGFWDFNVDDSYIGYRIAENVAAGHGWVYNSGEQINGATSPLWTLILTVGGAFGVTLALSHLLTAVCIFLAGYLTWRLCAQFLGPYLSLLAGVLVQTHPMLVLSISMETWLYLTFALASIWFWFSGRSVLLGVCLSATVLARPDGILLAGILLTLLWIEERLSWQPVVAFLLPLLAWAAFSFWEFGSPIPNTLAAKMAQGRSGLWSLPLPPVSFLPLFLKGLIWWLKQIYGIPVLLLVSVFSTAGLSSVRKWHPILTVVVVWGAAHLVAYSALKVPHYHWYYSPVLLAILCGSLAGFQVLLEKSARRRLVWGCIALAGLFVVFRQVEETYQRYAMLPEGRNAAYEELGNWLRENTQPNSRVAAAEIGIIGYASGRPMVDMAGLIHEEGPGELLKPNPAWWLAKRTPEIVIAHSPAWEFEKVIEVSPEYRLVYRLPSDRYQALRVFERVGSGAMKHQLHPQPLPAP
jgi:arabinofuranosyltransferase